MYEDLNPWWLSSVFIIGLRAGSEAIIASPIILSFFHFHSAPVLHSIFHLFSLLQ